MPQPPPRKQWYDKLADAILGDDDVAGSPSSRYALICQKCFVHNGLVKESAWQDTRESTLCKLLRALTMFTVPQSMYASNVATSILPLVLSNKTSRPPDRVPSQPQTAEDPMVSMASRTCRSISLPQPHRRKGSLDCPRSLRNYVLGGLSSVKKTKKSARRGTLRTWMSTTIPPRVYRGWFVFGSVHLAHLHTPFHLFPLFQWSPTPFLFRLELSLSLGFPKRIEHTFVLLVIPRFHVPFN